MSEEAPGPPQVPGRVDRQASLYGTSDPDVAEAVAAAARLQREVDEKERRDLQLRPPLSQLQPLALKSSSDIAPTTHNKALSPEEQAAVRKLYVTLTTDILESVPTNMDTPKEGPVVGAALGSGPTLRVVTVGEGPPDVKKARPDTLAAVNIYGEGWIRRDEEDDSGRIIRETYSGDDTEVVVNTVALDPSTKAPMERGQQRAATLVDMDRLRALFDEVKQAHAGAPAAGIAPAYQPLIYNTPKAIGPAQQSITG